MTESAKGAALAALRQRLAFIERGGRAERPALPFGVSVIDAVLPGGGLACGALHELSGDAGEDAAATCFLAGVLARLMPPRPVLWCSARADLHAPGLALHGLSPERLILVRAAERALLATMEEGLRCRALAAVIGEVEALPDHAGRRLQLAAETSGVTAFALRRPYRAAPPAVTTPTAAVTRWRIAACPSLSPAVPHPSDGIGWPLWTVALMRCRGGVPGRWVVEACDATGHVHLVDALADRPAAAPRRAAG